MRPTMLALAAPLSVVRIAVPQDADPILTGARM